MPCSELSVSTEVSRLACGPYTRVRRFEFPDVGKACEHIESELVRCVQSGQAGQADVLADINLANLTDTASRYHSVGVGVNCP